jgi:hypothetical protein
MAKPCILHHNLTSFRSYGILFAVFLLYTANSELSRTCKLTKKDSRTILSPLAFYLPQTFLIVTMLIVGGMGSVSGTVVGTVVITAILKSAQH